MKPTIVSVEWSEAGGALTEGAVMGFREFEAHAKKAALAHRSGGYLKTMVTVHFDDGSTYKCRLDLGAHDPLEKGFEHGIKMRIKHHDAIMAREMPEHFRAEQKKLHAVWVQMDFEPDRTWCLWEIQNLAAPVDAAFCTLTIRH